MGLTTLDTIDNEDIWLRRLARRVGDYCRMQDRDGVIALDVGPWSAAGTTTFASIGRLAANELVLLQIALQPVPQTIVRMGEISPASVSRDLAAWFWTTDRAFARRLVTAGNSFYPGAIKLGRPGSPRPSVRERYERPAFLESARTGSTYGIRVNLTVPQRDRAPILLFIADLAFFFVQTARLASGLRSYSPDKARYARAASPGPLANMPGSNGVLSLFQCPDCRQPLQSHESACSRCGWELYNSRRSDTEDDSPFRAELRDT